MTTDRTDMMWPDQVAAAANLSPGSVRAMAGKARALAAAGNLPPEHLPAPDGRAKRQIPTGGGTDSLGRPVPDTRTVWQSYWWPETIEAWLPRRRGRGNPNWTGQAASVA